MPSTCVPERSKRSAWLCCSTDRYRLKIFRVCVSLVISAQILLHRGTPVLFAHRRAQQPIPRHNDEVCAHDILDSNTLLVLHDVKHIENALLVEASHNTLSTPLQITARSAIPHLSVTRSTSTIHTMAITYCGTERRQMTERCERNTDRGMRQKNKSMKIMTGNQSLTCRSLLSAHRRKEQRQVFIAGRKGLRNLRKDQRRALRVPIECPQHWEIVWLSLCVCWRLRLFFFVMSAAALLIECTD